MSQALCFNEISFTPVTHQNSLWIRAVELARALGYSSEKSVSNIYNRNQDEFSNEMSVVINLSTTASPAPTRIFSLRGCHLLAMFARTPVAKQFRRWVLDVLDKLAEEERAKTEPVENPDKLPSLSPAHRSELKGIVDAKLSTYPASVQGKARSEIWTRFNRHFRIAEYAQLPAERMAEARDYLIELEVKALKALPSAPSTPLAIENSRIPNAMEELRKLVTHCGMVRNIIHIECHPGGKSMRMTLDEREIYDTLYQLYCVADDSLLAAYRALDAGYKIGRQYGRG